MANIYICVLDTVVSTGYLLTAQFFEKAHIRM